VKPHALFEILRPDEVAETWDELHSDSLYRALWASLAGEKPLSEQIDMEESGPEDAVGICSVASLWSKFTPEEQKELNETAERHQESIDRLFMR
jgi:hypothetical protein